MERSAEGREKERKKGRQTDRGNRGEKSVGIDPQREERSIIKIDVAMVISGIAGY